MEVKHTPGPWFVSAAGNVVDTRRCRVAMVDYMPGGLDEEKAANANLIAAAPELLATCEELFREILKSSAADNMDYGDYMRISGVLKKAKGET